MRVNIATRIIPDLDLMTQAFTGHYHAHGEVSEADCVIGLSFGYRGKPGHATPGLSNQDLANFAIKHFPDLPKILQFEIADAYEEAEGAGAKDIMRVSQHRLKGKYLDTREVAAQAQLLMKQHGYKRAALLAHPNHMPRVDAVCAKLGIQTIVVEGLKGAIEFDPQSTQKWTRELDQWRGYEPQAIEFYQLKGWL
jgi:uncharacterized SAM-binding protein YcdF (DUF218 family)